MLFMNAGKSDTIDKEHENEILKVPFWKMVLFKGYWISYLLQKRVPWLSEDTEKNLMITRSENGQPVDTDGKEVLLGVYAAIKHDTADLVNLMTTLFIGKNIDLKRCVRQGPDGASALSGVYVGVQKQIKNIQLNAEELPRTQISVLGGFLKDLGHLDFFAFPWTVVGFVGHKNLIFLVGLAWTGLVFTQLLRLLLMDGDWSFCTALTWTGLVFTRLPLFLVTNSLDILDWPGLYSAALNGQGLDSVLVIFLFEIPRKQRRVLSSC
ncbi:zinc finger MYM-type protein 1-like [Trichonephila clavipes]|nr:zinc finger MYM-type protein 1-like [Trichonephila clavipes]